MPETTSQRPAAASEPIHPSQAVAANLRRLRSLQRLSQEDIAQRMTALGYGRAGKPGGRADARSRAWGRSTVSEAESGKRELTVDELVGLSIILGVPIGGLLDPGEASLALGDVAPEDEPSGAPLLPRFTQPFLRSDIAFELTEHAPGRFMLRTKPVKGRLDEYLKAIGVKVMPEPINETEEQ